MLPDRSNMITMSRDASHSENTDSDVITFRRSISRCVCVVDLRRSQLRPVNVLRHSHRYAFNMLMQVPKFWQGFDVHSFTAAITTVYSQYVLLQSNIKYLKASHCRRRNLEAEFEPS